MNFKQLLQLGFDVKVLAQFDKILKEKVLSDRFDITDKESLLIEVLKKHLEKQFQISENNKQKNEKKDENKEQNNLPYGEIDENGEVVSIDYKLDLEVNEYLKNKKEKEHRIERKREYDEMEIPMSFVEGENLNFNMKNEILNLFKSIPKRKKVTIKNQIEFYQALIDILEKYDQKVPDFLFEKLENAKMRKDESFSESLITDTFPKKKKGTTRDDKRFIKKIQREIFPIETKESSQVIPKTFEANITKEMIQNNMKEFELVFEEVLKIIKDEKKIKIHEILKFREYYKKKYLLDDPKTIEIVSNSNLSYYVYEEQKLNNVLLQEMKNHFKSHSDSLEKIFEEVYPSTKFQDLVDKSIQQYEWYLQCKKEDESLENLKKLIQGTDDQIPSVNLTFDEFLSYIKRQVDQIKSLGVFDSQQQEPESVDWLLDQSKLIPPKNQG